MQTWYANSPWVSQQKQLLLCKKIFAPTQQKCLQIILVLVYCDDALWWAEYPFVQESGPLSARFATRHSIRKELSKFTWVNTVGWDHIAVSSAQLLSLKGATCVPTSRGFILRHPVTRTHPCSGACKYNGFLCYLFVLPLKCQGTKFQVIGTPYL